MIGCEDMCGDRYRLLSTIEHYHLTLKMASAQVVETSVTNNSPSQDSYHPDDLFQSRYATPGFKPFSYLSSSSQSYCVGIDNEINIPGFWCRCHKNLMSLRL